MIYNQRNSGVCFEDDNYRKVTSDEENFHSRLFIPKIAGTYNGTVIITGGGKTMWEDYHEAKKIVAMYDVMCVNMSCMFVPEATHVYSMHYKQLSAWASFRKCEYPHDKALYHGTKPFVGIDYVWYATIGSSTSGLGALALAKLLGYSKFILCGVPLDDSGYFYKKTKNEAFPDNTRMIEIKMARDKLGDSVKSMSGRTKEVFGSPTVEWSRRK